MTRDEKGRFLPGAVGNPNGRPPKQRELRFYEITLETVSFEDWKRIVGKAKEQALRGDAVARKWLADYIVGVPEQKVDVTTSGGPILLRVVYDDRIPDSSAEAA